MELEVFVDRHIKAGVSGGVSVSAINPVYLGGVRCEEVLSDLEAVEIRRRNIDFAFSYGDSSRGCADATFLSGSKTHSCSDIRPSVSDISSQLQNICLQRHNVCGVRLNVTIGTHVWRRWLRAGEGSVDGVKHCLEIIVVWQGFDEHVEDHNLNVELSLQVLQVADVLNQSFEVGILNLILRG